MHFLNNCVMTCISSNKHHGVYWKEEFVVLSQNQEHFYRNKYKSGNSRYFFIGLHIYQWCQNKRSKLYNYMYILNALFDVDNIWKLRRYIHALIPVGIYFYMYR